ncbi:hypothetical protein [Flagellimonas sp.]|uniref:hypothetical protein n=1 Tax=Flagellimonas sp. TaxID=2058762 RepID=UPI003B515A63
MHTKSTLLLSAFAYIIISCSSSIEPVDQSLAPDASDLVYPENNKECTTGIEVDVERSTVNFQWNSSANTDYYEIIIKELGTNVEIKENSNTTELEVTIKKGAAFQWQVVSKSNISSETATSEVWKFYNAGDGIVNHVPFPADVITPSVGGNLDSSTANVILEWSASDIDNDITGYEVFFGTQNPPINSMGQTADSNIEVSVGSGNTYYWIINTTDSANNMSVSDVFWFEVN